MRSPFPSSRGRQVPGVGNPNAAGLFLGEAPGWDEQRAGVPFVGGAGRWQEEHGWRPHRLKREDFYIDNVCQIRPDNNELSSIRDLPRWQTQCHTRLDRRPTVIIPTGNLALNTVLRTPVKRKKDGSWSFPNKIGNYRGSIFTYTTNSGYTCKVIPTWHPAYLMRDAHAYPAWRDDWARIAGDLHFPETNRVIDGARYLVAESEEDCRWFYKTLRNRLSVASEVCERCLLIADIETPQKIFKSIAFTFDGRTSLTIPTTTPWAWKWVKRILLAGAEVAFHGGVFDVYWLWMHAGIWPRYWRWDTKDLHHMRDPGDKHNLAYCCSREIRTCYWKDESKESETGGGYGQFGKNLPALYRYNGMDVINTYWLLDSLLQWLDGEGEAAHQQYHHHYRKVVHEAVRLSCSGIQVDRSRMLTHQRRHVEQLTTLRAEIEHAVGKPLHATTKNSKGSLVPQKVQAYFYTDLKCRPVRKGGRVTADEEAVRKLMSKYPKARPVGQLILDFRRHDKLLQFCNPVVLDDDDRFRAAYKPTPVTGRLASSKNAMGGGDNAQNRDSAIADIFIPNRVRPTHLFGRWDASQVESRLVFGATGDRELVELARTPPWELDQHTLNARDIWLHAFGEQIPLHKITGKQRKLGKHTVHAGNYGMGGHRMSGMVMVMTESEIIMSPEECQELIDAWFTARPAIPAWQTWVVETMVSQGYIEDSWGFRLYHHAWRVDTADYKEWYAFQPQADGSGRTTHQLAWLPTATLIRHEGLDAELVMHRHDEVVVSGTPEALWRINQLLQQSWTQRREYPGVQGKWWLEIPVGTTVAPTLGKDGAHEWKAPPTKRKFLDVARSIQDQISKQDSISGSVSWTQSSRTARRGRSTTVSTPAS